MLTLDKALQSAGLFSFQEQQVQNSYYCELKDIADAFEKHLELAEYEQDYINKTPELKSILESIKNDRGE